MTLQIPPATYSIVQPDQHALKPMLNPTYSPETSSQIPVPTKTIPYSLPYIHTSLVRLMVLEPLRYHWSLLWCVRISALCTHRQHYPPFRVLLNDVAMGL